MQAIESSSYAANEIELSTTGKITTSSIAPNSFLVHKASREEQTFVRPVNLPRSSNGDAKIVDTPDLSVEQDISKFSLNRINDPKEEDRASKTDPNSLKKSTRQSDVSLSDDSNSSGSLNDILTGLLNVVGEGLSIASNYVKENQKKKSSQVPFFKHFGDFKNVEFNESSNSRYSYNKIPFSKIEFGTISVTVRGSYE